MAPRPYIFEHQFIWNYEEDENEVVVPPAGFEPTAPGLGIPFEVLCQFTWDHIQLETQDFPPLPLTSDYLNLAGVGHLMDT